MRARLKGAPLEALVLDPDGELLEDGCTDFLRQLLHLFVGKKIGVALDDRGLDGGIHFKHCCPGSARVVDSSRLLVDA